MLTMLLILLGYFRQ